MSKVNIESKHFAFVFLSATLYCSKSTYLTDFVQPFLHLFHLKGHCHACGEWKWHPSPLTVLQWEGTLPTRCHMWHSSGRNKCMVQFPIVMRASVFPFIESIFYMRSYTPCRLVLMLGLVGVVVNLDAVAREGWTRGHMKWCLLCTFHVSSCPRLFRATASRLTL